jgi:hypothetical protein
LFAVWQPNNSGCLAIAVPSWKRACPRLSRKKRRFF